jgi:hypothetical protein
MRKFLGTAMGLALLSGAVVKAQADLLQNVQATGSIDIQARNIDNAYGPGAGDNFQGKVGERIGAGLSFDVNSEASAKLSVYDNNNAWSGTTGQTITGGAGVLDQLWLGEANVTLKDVLWLNHTIGRQYYNDGGDLLVRYGPTANYVAGLPVTSIDAWRVDWKNDNVNVHAIAGKTLAASPGFGAPGAYLGATPQTDNNLEGVEGWYTAMSAANLGARVYNFTITDDPAYGARNLDASAQVLDLMAKGSPVSGLDYKVELLRDFGTDLLPGAVSADGGRVGADGMGLLANAKYVQDLGPAKVHFMGEFGYGEGDATSGKGEHTFQTINSDYRPGLIWGGLSAVAPGGLGGFNGAGLSGANGSGLLTGNVGVKVNPAACDKLWVGLMLYDFNKSAADPTMAGAPGAGSTAKGIGDEGDLTLTWKQSENTSIRIGYALFKPGTALGDGNTIRMEAADVSLRFQ